MITETREVYKCDHCRRMYQRRHFCISHEEICIRNPENQRSCFSCPHLTKKQTVVYVDSYIGEQEIKVELLFCGKVDTFLYPPRVERNKNWYDTDPVKNNPMPRDCEILKKDSEWFDDFMKSVKIK